jgi:hypothetical protein
MKEENFTNVFQKEMKKGWALLGLALLLFLAGIVPPILGWQTFYTPRIAVALGILVVGWALAILIRFGIARRNAGSMKRAMIEETDERQLLIRSRAGYDAFTLSIPTTSIGLILYSAISRDLPQPDPFWYYMIFMTLLPIVIYVFRTLKYAKEY